VSQYFLGFFLPALAGNALGGVVLVAALAHAQHAPAES
jgi:formate/nitrite transporter FocA (FNT family)